MPTPSVASAQSQIEQQTMRKVSLRLLPLLFALYIASYLDRTNVGIAALQMNSAIGLSAAAYGLGAGIFFIGYAIFEVPSNIILARVGARRWIARIAISWGLISCAMIFARGPLSFYALRLLLGLAEAGYFPGILFYMSQWFPERHRARAISRFMIGIPIASAVGGPLGGALLGLNGHFGLGGWQWLFIVEGIPAVIMGFVVLAVLKERPADAKWLAPAEHDWLAGQLASEGSRKGTQERGILETMRNPTVLWLAAPYFLTLLGGLTVLFIAPTIIKDVLHFDNFHVGLVMGAIGLVSMTGMLINGWHSDHTGERILHAAGPLLVMSLGFSLAAFATEPVLRVIGLGLVVCGHNSFNPPFWCLPPSFLRGVGAATGIALINSIGNLGGFFGPIILGAVKDRAGSYIPGLAGMAVMALCAAAIAASLKRASALAR